MSKNSIELNAAISDMEFTAAESSKLINVPGAYVVTIKNVLPRLPKNEQQKLPDPRMQIQIQCTTEDGKEFSDFRSTEGFVRYDELSETDKTSGMFVNIAGYAVSTENDRRIEDPIRTQKCKDMIRNIGFAAGFDAEQTFKLTQLIGRKIVIVVAQDDTNRLVVSSVRRPSGTVANLDNF